jgi:hypothetical protein
MLLAILITFSASTAFAEENYGVPTQFRTLTPEEVQVDTALTAYHGRLENAPHAGVVLEPVLIKCINGAPGFYYVFTYKGVETYKREAMEGIIRLFNEEGGFYVEEITPFLNTARENYNEYGTFMYEAWDFGGCYCNTQAIDGLLYEFEMYVEIAEKCLDIKGPAKIKLYAEAPSGSKIIFGLKEAGKDEKFMWTIGQSGWSLDDEGRVEGYAGFGEATRREISDNYGLIIDRLCTKLEASPEIFYEDVSYWADLPVKAKNLQKEAGYYLIVEPEFEQ